MSNTAAARATRNYWKAAGLYGTANHEAVYGDPRNVRGHSRLAKEAASKADTTARKCCGYTAGDLHHLNQLVRKGRSQHLQHTLHELFDVDVAAL